MPKTIQIDIVSDVVCPWCIIGWLRLNAAIQALDCAAQINIQWQPFQLNPTMPPEGELLDVHLNRKYGTTPAGSQQFQQQLTELGAELGFEFNYHDQLKAINTLDAHVLLDYAAENGLQTELKTRLFSAFYNEKKDISVTSQLIDECKQVGLDGTSAVLVLNDPARRQQVLALAEQWRRLGVSGVPTIIFNRESAITGAQSIDTYKQALSALIAA